MLHYVPKQYAGEHIPVSSSYWCNTTVPSFFVEVEMAE